jgi:hypothetical protein
MSLFAAEEGRHPAMEPMAWGFRVETAEHLQERPEQGIFVLPGGYVDEEGRAHYEVEMSPVTGREEEYLASLPQSATSADTVTGLLAKCVERVGSLDRVTPSLIGNLLVADRDYLMIRLREMTFGKRVEAKMSCTECGKLMDLTFSLDDINIERKALTQRYFLLNLDATADGANLPGSDGLSVEFRLPTGAMQKAATVWFDINETRAANTLLSLCIRRIGNLTGVDELAIEGLGMAGRRQIEEAIKQHAPAAEIELEAECPECHSLCQFQMDFNAFFFAEMRQNLRSFELEVHFLAKHYHWPESEILSMTRRKRQRYVSLLREEMES